MKNKVGISTDKQQKTSIDKVTSKNHEYLKIGTVTVILLLINDKS